MERLKFNAKIHAPVEQVFETMIGKEGYKQWTSVFCSTSDVEGTWAEGEKIMFVAINKEGKREGMLGRVKAYEPEHFVSVEYYGVLDGDQEITEGEVAAGFRDMYENFSFEPNGSGTNVSVDVDVEDGFKAYLLETYPKALDRLKEICERS